jgi:hypothetical protein
MEQPKFKPAQQEIADGKAECYWCDRVFPVVEMIPTRQYGVEVHICKNCQS